MDIGYKWNPQGSVLGQTFYPMCVPVYASYLQTMLNILELNELQDDLNRLMEWSEIWQLLFNLEKCKSLHIGRSNVKHVYKMKGKHLKQVVGEKDLGVNIDNELKFHTQTAAAIKGKSKYCTWCYKKIFCIFRRHTTTVVQLTIFWTMG